jgi:hypothetical protein
MKKLLTVCILAISVLLSGGCAVVLVGAGAAGTAAYVRGDLQAVLEADINRAFAASEKAIQNLELRVEEKQKDQFFAKIEARNAVDKKVTVKIKSTSDTTCEISIRIGVWGDQAQSVRIYEKIRTYL